MWARRVKGIKEGTCLMKKKLLRNPKGFCSTNLWWLPEVEGGGWVKGVKGAKRLF